MKFLATAMITALLSLSAQAKDSTWLLCSNDQIAMNVLEHRAGADTRATSLNLILGAHIISGTLENKDSGEVTLSADKATSPYVYKGKVEVDYAQNTVTLEGFLIIDNEQMFSKQVLTCKDMSGGN